jgi:uncharacterized OsmC-like protein
MTADELKALQTPIKTRYQADPAAACVVLEAVGQLDQSRLTCRVRSASSDGFVEAGLHPAAGGDGSGACSGEMLLEALVACAGVTLCAVATALSITIRGGMLIARGTMDFRGTLGVSRETPVGFQSIQLDISLDSGATSEQLDKLVQLTERYCVIYQTLRSGVSISSRRI